MSDELVEAAKNYQRAKLRYQQAVEANREVSEQLRVTNMDFKVAEGRLKKLMGNKTRVIDLGEGSVLVSRATLANEPIISVEQIERA